MLSVQTKMSTSPPPPPPPKKKKKLIYSSFKSLSQEDFRIGLLFKFGQAVPEIFKFLYLKKLGLFGILSGYYIGVFEHWNAPPPTPPKTPFFLFYNEIRMKKN